jgi:hypothetical protein
MSCNLPEELLALHAGGDLTVAEASQVESHIATCAPCAAEIEAYRSARHALLEIREESQPEISLWTELDARLDAVDAAGRHRLPWFRRFGFAPVMMTAAALLLAVVFYPDPTANPTDLGQGDPTNEFPLADVEPKLTPRPFKDALHFLRFNPHVEQGVPAAFDQSTEGAEAGETKNAVNLENLPQTGNKEKI